MPVKKNKQPVLIFEKNGLGPFQRATLNLLQDLEAERQKLAEAKAKDEAMLACIGDGVVAIGLDAKILVMNDAARAMMRCQGLDVVGKPYTDFWTTIDEGGREVTDSQLSAQMAVEPDKVIKASNFYYVPKNGGVKFPVSLSIAPIKLNGKTVGIIDVFRDITHEKEIDKAKTEFVSLASHQLRTPLTSVSWYVEMFLSDYAQNLSDRQKKYLDEVYKGNQRMVALVNTLLNVSRLELGTFASRPEPTDVVKLAQRVIGELQLQIDQKQLKFEQRYGQGLPLLNVDPIMFGMIVQNLLSNAIKYTPDKGSVSIVLRLALQGELLGNQKLENDSVVIVVSDTGFGIPEKQQDKIFTKLFRADNVREKDTDGTGLGLYIVKSIAEKSGGKVWFDSQENKGTAFYVALPLRGTQNK